MPQSLHKGPLLSSTAVADDEAAVHGSGLVPPEVKSRLTRAATLNHVDLTSIVTQAALREADAVIAAAEQIKLADDSYMRLLALLQNPPAPNDKLLAAAKRCQSLYHLPSWHEEPIQKAHDRNALDCNDHDLNQYAKVRAPEPRKRRRQDVSRDR